MNDRFPGESRQSIARFSARWLESTLSRYPARSLKALTQPQVQGQGAAQLFLQHDVTDKRPDNGGPNRGFNAKTLGEGLRKAWRHLVL
jgi:hypothetical protein